MEVYCRFSLSRNRKINLEPLNYKIYEFKYDRRLNNKQFLQVSGLCSAPFASDLPKCSTQIYKAQYGEATFVLLRGAQIWRLYITENIWNSIMLSKRLLFARDLVSFHINTTSYA